MFLFQRINGSRVPLVSDGGLGDVIIRSGHGQLAPPDRVLQEERTSHHSQQVIFRSHGTVNHFMGLHNRLCGLPVLVRCQNKETVLPFYSVVITVS